MRINVDYGSYEKYLDPEKLKRLVECSEERLRGVGFDAIAVCGISGLLVGAPLAIAMGKSLVVVRKPGELRSSIDPARKFFAQEIAEAINDARTVMGGKDNEKVLLVDDHVASGATLKLMVESIDRGRSNVSFAGLFLYGEHKLLPRWYRDTFGYQISHSISRANGEPVKISVLTL